jgi:hypothetical protein
MTATGRKGDLANGRFVEPQFSENGFVERQLWRKLNDRNGSEPVKQKTEVERQLTEGTGHRACCFRQAAIQSKAGMTNTGPVPTSWSYAEDAPEKLFPTSAVNLTGIRNLRNPTSKCK